jgi:hypothetical protein
MNEQAMLEELDNKREYATMLADKLRELQEANMMLSQSNPDAQE